MTVYDKHGRIRPYRERHLYARPDLGTGMKEAIDVLNRERGNIDLHPPDELRLQLERIAGHLGVQLMWRQDEEGNMMAGIRTKRGEAWVYLNRYLVDPWECAFAKLGIINRPPPRHVLQNPNAVRHDPKPVLHALDPNNSKQTLCGCWNMPPGLYKIVSVGGRVTCSACQAKLRRP